jgi:hypothetical protein
MGSLDDAIREHLELKRRHGASDEELQQQEREAFGPAPSGAWQTVPAEPASQDAGPEVREPEDLEEEVGAAEAGPAMPEPNGLDLDQLEPDEVLPEDSLEGGSAAAGARDWDAGEGPNGASEQAASEDLEVSDDDVLEETPDFLEDAPEQDQLWFEQKPPKDFDFGD